MHGCGGQVCEIEKKTVGVIRPRLEKKAKRAIYNLIRSPEVRYRLQGFNRTVLDTFQKCKNLQTCFLVFFLL